MPNIILAITAVFLLQGFVSFNNSSFSPSRNFKYPDLIEMDAFNNILIVENGWKRIVKINQSGDQMFAISGGNRSNGFYEAWYITSDSTGYFYILNCVRDKENGIVTKEEIQRYTPFGTFDRIILELSHSNKINNPEEEFPFGRIMDLKICNDSLYYLYRIGANAELHAINLSSFKENIITVINNHEMIIDFAVFNRNVYVTQKDGSILKISFDTTQSTNINYNGSIITPYQLSIDNAGGLFVSDIGSSSIIKIDNNKTSTVLSNKILGTFNIKPDTFLAKNISVNNKGLCASVDEINSRIIIINNLNTKPEIINKIHYSLLTRLFTCLYITAAAAFIFIIIINMYYLYKILFSHRMTITFKLVIVSSIIYIVSISIIAHVAFKEMYKTQEKEILNKLAMIAMTSASSINADALSRITKTSDYLNNDYKLLQTQLKSLINNNIDEWDKDLYIVLYREYNGMFYYTVDLTGYYGTRYPYTKTVKIHHEAIKGKPGYAIYSDAEGDWMIGVSPVINSQGTIIGLCEVGTNLYLKYEILDSFFNKLTLLLLGLAIVIAFIMFIMYRFLLSPLTKLVRASQSIEQGNFNITVDIHSHDELEDVSHSINSMTSRISQYINEIEEKNRELEGRDALKDLYLTNTTHELRTPLNGIIGITESILDRADDCVTEKNKNDLELILSSSRRLSSAIDDIIDYSSIKNQTVTLTMTPVDIEEVIRYAVSLFTASLRGKPIAIISSINKLPYIFGDRNRIEQILFNLIGNALKFTDTGYIIIDASVDESVLIRIRDTGIGIPEHLIETVFDPFEQIDGSITRKYGGIGLGLFISKKLTELHGGTIKANSDQGRGSEFVLSFPIPYSPITQEEYNNFILNKSDYSLDTPYISGKPSGINHTVLIVDDDQINLEVLRNILSHNMFLVTAYSDSVQALNAIMEGKEIYDFAILDLMMPTVSGFDLLNTLRNKFSYIDMPILMLTAKKSPEDIARSLMLGANDYIPKPFNKSDLINRIKKLLYIKDIVNNYRFASAEDKEHMIAQQIHMSLLNSDDLSIQGIDCASLLIPSKNISGDFFDFKTISGVKAGIFAADVTGTGLEATLSASKLKTAFYLQSSFEDDPITIFENINSILTNKIFPGFVTASYLYIDSMKKIIKYSRAGYTPLFIMKSNSGFVTEIKPKGKILGHFNSVGCECYEASIESGDVLVICSDGLIQAMDSRGNYFGYNGVVSSLKAASGGSASEILNNIMYHGASWTGGTDDFADDALLIVIRIV
jgi:signal transduction histidine kinase/serine phosphatase RsbU (regulator of sigma subunit)